jgi:hypothetical protein
MYILSVLTLLKITHLIGLIMGLGGAILADTTIFTRGVIRPVSAYTVHQAKFLSHVVSFGLVILWLSGGALIWVNTLAHPEYLTNQKLWAKMVIVVMLTINGVLVHKLVLPMLEKSLGNRLFDHVDTKRVLGMTFLGSVSFVSWTVPFVLGKASELNYVTPMLNILVVYIGFILVSWIGMFTVMSSIQKIRDYIRRAAHLTMQRSAKWEKMSA